MIFPVFLFSLHFCRAQYGFLGNYGNGANYLTDPLAPPMFGFVPPIGDGGGFAEKRDCSGLGSMRARSICRFANPMTSPFLSASGCSDLSPQCALWASTGQCASNPLLMRSTCAMSCGTCLTGISPLSSPSMYNPLGISNPMGYSGYPISPYMRKSIYETGILRQQTPNKIGFVPDNYRVPKLPGIL